MKQLFFAVLAACLLSGCAHYDLMLTNGMRITNVTKPKLDKFNDVYVYKDVAGNQRYVSAGRVIEIAPHSSKDEGPFNGR